MGSIPTVRSMPLKLRKRSGGIVNRRAERKSLWGLQFSNRVGSVGDARNCSSAWKMIQPKGGGENPTRTEQWPWGDTRGLHSSA